MLYIRVLDIIKRGEYGLMAKWACTAETLDLLPLNLESFGVILHVCPSCCDGCLLNLIPDVCVETNACICSHIVFFISKFSVRYKIMPDLHFSSL